MLLLNDLRNSFRIDLTNSVVIFDEAHNLVETVNHVYSADMTYVHLDLASQCVTCSARFQSTFTRENHYYVNVLVSVIKSSKHCLTADKIDSSTSTGSKVPPSSIPVTGCKVLGANDFLFSCGLDYVNKFKLRNHITEADLENKVGRSATHQANK